MAYGGSPLHTVDLKQEKGSLILDVKTCDVFICCATIVVLLSIVFASSFYVNGELHRFLHRGLPMKSLSFQHLPKGRFTLDSEDVERTRAKCRESHWLAYIPN